MRIVVTYDRLTVSPYNRNSDGTVKTAAEVRASVVASVREWERVVEPCASHKVVVG